MSKTTLVASVTNNGALDPVSLSRRRRILAARSGVKVGMNFLHPPITANSRRHAICKVLVAIATTKTQVAQVVNFTFATQTYEEYSFGWLELVLKGRIVRGCTAWQS